MRGQLFTIGYQQRDVPEFARLLREFDVDVLVDVRERPLSRKKGFSKSALDLLLREMDKTYLHLGRLGSPAPLRARLHRDGDYETFFADYGQFIKAPDASNALGRISALVDDGKTICLMCFERESRFCHRSVIAEQVTQKFGGLQVIHI